MALALESSNTSFTPTLGTEHTLATPTTSGIRIIRVWLHNLATNINGGETVEIRIKVPITAGGTLYDEYYQSYTAPVGLVAVESVAVASDVGCSFTLKQVSTTGAVARLTPWKIYTL